MKSEQTNQTARIIALLGCVVVLASNMPLLAQPATPPVTQPGRGGGGGGANSADYPFPYRAVTPEQIADVLNRVHAFVEPRTPWRMVHRETGAPITDFSSANPDAVLEQGQFQMVSYEWGVTYRGMIQAHEATGDARFKDYVEKRMQLLGNMLPLARAQAQATTQPAGGARGADAARGGRGEGGGGGGGGRGGGRGPFGGMLNPNSLDASGSMCAALLSARLANMSPDLMIQINTYIDWIHNRQFRFADRTLARNRPLPNTLWLDDLYMSVPALALMGKVSGEKKYYDDGAKQILQFAERMFVKEKGLWAHGWTMSAEEHPAFHWARANGWAAMAITELLEVLPADHPQRADVMKIYKAFMKGLAQVQSGQGLWHNVLDRNDSYLETSATAMFTYAMARGINRGWLDPVTYGPVAMLGWNGLAPKVTAQGQVEDVCVATDLAFDYAFYYYRPKSSTVPHGFGPVLLAGAEMTKLVKAKEFRLSFQALNHIPQGAVIEGPGARGGANRGGRGGGGGAGGRGE